MVNKAFVCLFLASFTVLASGCGSDVDLKQIKGVVTHNGKPVPSLYLTFMPADPATQAASSSSTDAEGRFELKIGSKGGVMPGKYTVTVSDPAAMMGGSSSDDPVYKEVCKKYAQGKSTYTFDVDKSNPSLELKLD